MHLLEYPSLSTEDRSHRTGPKDYLRQKLILVLDPKWEESLNSVSVTWWEIWSLISVIKLIIDFVNMINTFLYLWNTKGCFSYNWMHLRLIVTIYFLMANYRLIHWLITFITIIRNKPTKNEFIIVGKGYWWSLSCVAIYKDCMSSQFSE